MTYVAIIAENRLILEAMGLVTLESMMFLYYICNLEYPKECVNTFILIQRMIMNVYDAHKSSCGNFELVKNVMCEQYLF